MSLSGSVVEDAIERNSWGGGRPDVNRYVTSQTPKGLHRTCGDAPLETPLPACS